MNDWALSQSPIVNGLIGWGASPLGLIQKQHDLVPDTYRQSPTGMYVTFVVADVDQVYAQAQAMSLPILQPPRNEFYGQRRFLTQDPNGCLLDICSPWENSG
jgi:uncharacterized glyoxalase superfamily protein PhnB